MSASTVVPAKPASARWPIFISAVVAGAYALGHLHWFASTPLGQVPVLDARENLSLANAIFDGTLPPEPFYRAPGYALLLATLRVCGVAPAGLFAAALSVGAGLHAANSALAAAIARAWFGAGAAVIAGLLFALNPIFVHFAVQANDATAALTCFLAGLALIAPTFVSQDEARRASTAVWPLASLLWAVATAMRPNYLLVWLTLPVIAWRVASSRSALRSGLASNPGAKKPAPPWQLSLGTLFAGGCVFAAVALWQGHISGSYGFLPAQGPYNLWAANKPGSHGRYFTQSVSLPADVAAQNPARAESVLLYQSETGDTTPTLAKANRYWRTRFIAEVMHRPLSWLSRLTRKGYALVNDWEQYNNETPAFHLARSPWLRWNPISWGVLFVFGVAGFARLRAERLDAIVPLSIIVVAVAASALFFFVSARFRLPLASIVTVLAGGALAPPRFWAAWPRPHQVALAIICIVGAGLTFSNFDRVRDPATLVQDHALLARAAETVGDDALAWREAEAALAMRADHPDALRLAISSYFNLLLTNAAPASDEPNWKIAASHFLAASNVDSADLRTVAAVAVWRAGAHDAALAEWRRLSDEPAAMAARLLADDATAKLTDFAAIIRLSPDQPLVRIAAAIHHIGPASLSEVEAATIARRLFPPSAAASHP
jgi:hypothetical protein